MDKCKYKVSQRKRRRKRIRKKISGTADRPRLSVFRSLRHMYAQVIDDETGCTLVAASTLSDDIAQGLKNSGNKQAAEAVGETLAKKALALGITHACFDRGGYKYHGRVKALADAARKAGLVM